jgi:hypothetical protein
MRSSAALVMRSLPSRIAWIAAPRMRREKLPIMPVGALVEVVVVGEEAAGGVAAESEGAFEGGHEGPAIGRVGGRFRRGTLRWRWWRTGRRSGGRARVEEADAGDVDAGVDERGGDAFGEYLSWSDTSAPVHTAAASGFAPCRVTFGPVSRH